MMELVNKMGDDLAVQARYNRNMDPRQKRNAIILAVLGLAYFTTFIFPNATGAKDENMLKVFARDEAVTYPYVVRMLVTPKDIHEASWRLLIYGDYHYGYPFYFLSMLSVLPVKLVAGDAYVDYTQLNLLLLRQLISVLPMVVAAYLLVYLQTRFRSLGWSALLFALILAVPGVVRNNLSWWHPDALAVLAVVLALFFLERDHLRLGRNFWLAAVFTGLAIAIKLLGFFMAPLLLIYVVAAYWQRQASFPQAIIRAAAFVGIMALVVVLSNPFLFYKSQRDKMVLIQLEKSQELYNGYTHDNPLYYQKGPRWWQGTLEKWYGPVPFLLLLTGLAAAGSIWGQRRFLNRLLIGWMLPYAFYLLYFVAVKPDHYWLPVMLPLFAGGLNLSRPQRENRWLWMGGMLIAGLLTWQLLVFLKVDGSLYLNMLTREAARGY